MINLLNNLKKARKKSKYYKNKSLKNYLRYNKVNIVSIIKNVKNMISRIQKRFPRFRHNDLHIGNIIVDDNRKLRLTDFELTRLTNRTPLIIRKFGITNKHNPKYDIHCFLNSLWRTGKFRSVLKRFLPRGYRGKTDTYVRNYRLTF